MTYEYIMELEEKRIALIQQIEDLTHYLKTKEPWHQGWEQLSDLGDCLNELSDEIDAAWDEYAWQCDLQVEMEHRAGWR